MVDQVAKKDNKVLGELKKKAYELQDRYQEKRCRHCMGKIVFKENEKNVPIPHDLDETPHWQSCPHGHFAQSKNALPILKKVALYHMLISGKNELDLEALMGLSKKEALIFNAVVHKALEAFEKESKSKDLKSEDKSEVVKDDILTFAPEPNDPVGDPDEERAPSEDLIKPEDIPAETVEVSEEPVEKDEVGD